MKHGVWMGNINCDSLSVSAVLYPIVIQRDIKLRLLDKRDFSPIGFKKISKLTGQDVPAEQVIEGYEYQTGSYITLSKNELESIRAKTTHEINITEFVNLQEMDPVLFFKHYYIVPENKSWRSYSLLRKALQNTGKVGVAKMVMYGRQYIATIRAKENVLIMELLRFSGEIHSVSGLNIPPRDFDILNISKKEVELTELLINNMTKKWDWEKYNQNYHNELLSLLMEKIAALKQFESSAKYPNKKL